MDFNISDADTIKNLTDEAINKTQIITYKFVINLLDKFPVDTVKEVCHEELAKLEREVENG